MSYYIGGATELFMTDFEKQVYEEAKEYCSGLETAHIGVKEISETYWDSILPVSTENGMEVIY